MKSIIDDVLERYMGLPEFEFVWASEEALSAQEQATIWATYLNAGVLTVDEVRAELGREPLPQQEQDDESPPSDNRLPEQLSQQENDQSQESEIDKLGKAKRPISEDEAAALIEAFLNEQADDVAEQIHALLQDLDIDFNAEDLQAELNRVADLVSGSLDFAKWAALVAIMAPILQETAKQAAHKALIDVIAEPAIGMGTAIRSRAVAWANERAAEMVGMKWIEGKLIQNPNAEWQITEGTRDMIRQAVKEAMTHGDSPQQLASRLKQSHAFSKWRSQTIARTEMARADGMGTYIGWVESGLVGGKQWITAEDDKVSEICNANHDAGVIGLHEYFPSGDLMQPSHPNCRCTVVAVLNEDLGKAYNPNQPRDKNGRWTSGGWRLSSLSDGAHADLSRKELHQLGVVDEANVAAVKKQIAIDLAGFGREVHDDELRHVTNSHGTQSFEKARGQRAVTHHDFKKLPDVVSQPDEVKMTGSKWMCLPTIEYHKKYGNETFVYIEAYRAKRKQVRFVSLRIHKRKR